MRESRKLGGAGLAGNDHQIRNPHQHLKVRRHDVKMRRQVIVRVHPHETAPKRLSVGIYVASLHSPTVEPRSSPMILRFSLRPTGSGRNKELLRSLMSLIFLKPARLAPDLDPPDVLSVIRAASVIPGRAQREPGIHDHGRYLGSQAGVTGPGSAQYTPWNEARRHAGRRVRLYPLLRPNRATCERAPPSFTNSPLSDATDAFPARDGDPRGGGAAVHADSTMPIGASATARAAFLRIFSKALRRLAGSGYAFRRPTGAPNWASPKPPS